MEHLAHYKQRLLVNLVESEINRKHDEIEELIKLYNKISPFTMLREVRSYNIPRSPALYIQQYGRAKRIKQLENTEMYKIKLLHKKTVKYIRSTARDNLTVTENINDAHEFKDMGSAKVIRDEALGVRGWDNIVIVRV